MTLGSVCHEATMPITTATSGNSWRDEEKDVAAEVLYMDNS